MKKFFIAFLICTFCFVSACIIEAEAKPASAGHNHCHSGHRSHHHHTGHGNYSSNPRILMYVENYDDTSVFEGCDAHSLVTHTEIFHYSDGSANTVHRHKILGNNNSIIADNLYYAKHFINSKGKHYFLIKSPEYGRKNYIIMDSKGNIAKTNGYSKYKVLGKDNLIVQQDKKYGIIDFDDNIVMDIKYKSIDDFNNILLTKYNGYYGLANIKGNIILENKYDKISKYRNIFILKYKDKYGIADLSGKILYTPAFDSIKKDGDFLKAKSNNKYGIIDINGKLVAPIKYQKVRVERNLPQIFTDKTWITVTDYSETM